MLFHFDTLHGLWDEHPFLHNLKLRNQGSYVEICPRSKCSLVQPAPCFLSLGTARHSCRFAQRKRQAFSWPPCGLSFRSRRANIVKYTVLSKIASMMQIILWWLNLSITSCSALSLLFGRLIKADLLMLLWTLQQGHGLQCLSACLPGCHTICLRAPALGLVPPPWVFANLIWELIEVSTYALHLEKMSRRLKFHHRHKAELLHWSKISKFRLYLGPAW